MAIETRVLEQLDEREGIESFQMQFAAGVTLRQARSALRRLAGKGQAQAVQCPDGAWVWFRLD